MSADFLLAACPLPIVAEGESLDDTERAAILQRRIDTLNDEVIVDLAERFLGIFDIDEEGLWKHEAFERLRDSLDFVEHGGSRETAVLTVEGRDWMFTGGMSSGDVPTEAFDDIWLLAISDITGDPLRKHELSGVIDPSDTDVERGS